MNQTPNLPVSEQAQSVLEYYDWTTDQYYMGQWNRDHIHFGLFEAGEYPENTLELLDSPGMVRAMERMIEVTTAGAMIREQQNVVDAGCGVGGTAIYLAQTTGCKVTGVNIHRGQIDTARKKAIAAGLDDKVAFEYADCSRSLPFADDSIDAVINIESACHYEDRGQFLREVNRILKPGGRIAAFDWMTRSDITSEQYQEHIQPVCDTWALSSLENQVTYTRLIQDAGMELIDFGGFNGKDMDNIKLLHSIYKGYAMMWFAGVSTPETCKVQDKCAALYRAWQAGYFVLNRYCAQKPQIA